MLVGSSGRGGAGDKGTGVATGSGTSEGYMLSVNGGGKRTTDQ